ncbi:MAG: DEAD/DEAH box helicase family protein, partial [Flammeovirgaceae bacterium]
MAHFRIGFKHLEGNCLQPILEQKLQKMSILSESQTRYNLIDPQLVKAGWNLSDRTQVWFEVPVEDSDQYPERLVAGFFTRADLERLLHLKLNKLPISEIKINEKIVNRSYQTEAIRRIGETIEKKKKRKALLVLATGTGKTRTTMALIDVFLRARQAQKVLFLADRDSLVDQTLTDGFKVYLPNEARTRIRSYEIDKTARVYVSTLQTLEICYNEFSPAEFDLIVADECHRSIYNKFTDVLAYFDAVQIGLTATPAHFIDRDTFKFFETD